MSLTLAATYQGIIRIGVTEQAADGEENFGHCEGGRPLRTQDVQADGAIAVDVRVVDAGGECKFRGLERVVRGEVDIEEKHPTLKGRVCWPENGRLRKDFSREFQADENQPASGRDRPPQGRRCTVLVDRWQYPSTPC